MLSVCPSLALLLHTLFIIEAGRHAAPVLLCGELQAHNMLSGCMSGQWHELAARIQTGSMLDAIPCRSHAEAYIRCVVSCAAGAHVRSLVGIAHETLGPDNTISAYHMSRCHKMPISILYSVLALNEPAWGLE